MRPAESFIGQPIRSLQTMLRVISEADSRIPTVIPDGIYGTTTQQAVTAFQRQNALPVTGVVNQQTWDRIVLVYEKAYIETEKAEPIEILIDKGERFLPGDSGPYIFLLQTLLFTILEEDSSAARVTGIFDDKTVQSLATFQKSANLPETGQLDKETWKHLSLQFTAKMHRLKSHKNHIN